MHPRIPRLSLYQKLAVSTALIAIMWMLVAVKILGLGVEGFSTLATASFEVGYTILGIILARSPNRTNKINGWSVVSYALFELFIGMGRAISHYS